MAENSIPFDDADVDRWLRQLADDLAATVFDRVGIPLDQELHDAQGRPLPLCIGKPVTGLF